MQMENLQAVVFLTKSIATSVKDRTFQCELLSPWVPGIQLHHLLEWFTVTCLYSLMGSSAGAGSRPMPYYSLGILLGVLYMEHD